MITRNDEEKAAIRDLIMSDAWTVFTGIYDELRSSAMETMVAVPDSGTFHRLQGVIQGMDMLVKTFEEISKPKDMMWSSTDSEYTTN
jgi:hypothetical protein